MNAANNHSSGNKLFVPDSSHRNSDGICTMCVVYSRHSCNIHAENNSTELGKAMSKGAFSDSGWTKSDRHVAGVEKDYTAFRDVVRCTM